ncbi:glycosyltransferase family 4 protein [Qipengyuania qiaonensis]|uniref:Glycosyltransferase family 4 protein n=1 Tax=Qipengyuania qiaonensis TaxID=2867240 RepID=A0ABS7JAH8_9SPHN|nr:glycosyltransferase family 1 protein [Qipengyuania qiaonensis]MBX7481992.1 glycosyltransferase family 4 protein [Qipengyuania qiaonensis]
MTRIVLDISRLISRVRHSGPSGVDRVEMAYARGLLRIYGGKLAFAAVHPSGVYGRIQRETAIAYLDELERRWAQTDGVSGQRSLISVLPWMARLFPRRIGLGSSDVLVQVSPHHLTRRAQMRRILARENARFVCMVHDLIPIEYPEYARPGGSALHEARMHTVAELAASVIVNSAATGDSLRRWIEDRGHIVPPIRVALLGTEPIAEADDRTYDDAKPYFVCLGTIEPRKNHLLLLHLWRSMAQSLPPESIPRLVVIGRRGWENEQIVDLLERCPSLKPFLEEVNGCGDEDLAAAIRGARALLMPSFAEGFGMPVAEALSVGTPVIASDIAAHREIGGTIPDYLDTLDGSAWMQAILDHARDGPLRRAQLERLNLWQAPDWDSHMAIAAEVIEAAAK